MHILVFPSWYPTDSNDISGIFFKEQAIALKDAGHFVSVLKPLISISKNPFHWSDSLFSRKLIIEKNLPTFSLTFFNWSGVFLKNETSRYKTIRSWFNRYISIYGLPDLIHAHSMYWGGMLANIISREFNVPYIITEHASDIARGQNHDKLQLKQIYNESFKVVCVSTFLLKALRNNYEVDANKLVVIPNLLSKIFNNKIINNAQNKRFTFLNIAALTLKKRHELLIEAFAELALKYDNVELRIGGSGDQKRDIENQIKNYKLENKILLLGKLDRKQVLEEVSKCNAFVLTSEIETFGVVLIEALSQGKPIIATDSGGTHDIVTEFNGYLVDLNKEAITLALENLYCNYNHFDQNRIREDCLNRYHSKSIVSKLESIYKEAIAT